MLLLYLMLNLVTNVFVSLQLRNYHSLMILISVYIFHNWYRQSSMSRITSRLFLSFCLKDLCRTHVWSVMLFSGLSVQVYTSSVPMKDSTWSWSVSWCAVVSINMSFLDKILSTKHWSKFIIKWCTRSNKLTKKRKKRKKRRKGNQWLTKRLQLKKSFSKL